MTFVRADPLSPPPSVARIMLALELIDIFDKALAFVVAKWEYLLVFQDYPHYNRD